MFDETHLIAALAVIVDQRIRIAELNGVIAELNATIVSLQKEQESNGDEH